MTSALIVRTIHKHNNISQTISLKGQTQTIKATPDTYYLITDSAGISPKTSKSNAIIMTLLSAIPMMRLLWSLKIITPQTTPL